MVVALRAHERNWGSGSRFVTTNRATTSLCAAGCKQQDQRCRCRNRKKATAAECPEDLLSIHCFSPSILGLNLFAQHARRPARRASGNVVALWGNKGCGTMRSNSLSGQFLFISQGFRGQGLISQNLSGFAIDHSFWRLLASRHFPGYL